MPQPIENPVSGLSRANWYVPARLPVHLFVPLLTVPGALPATLFWMFRMLLLMFWISAGSSASPLSFTPALAHFCQIGMKLLTYASVPGRTSADAVFGNE